MQETWVGSPSWEYPLEKEMATCSSIPAWRIARTEEPGRHTGNLLLRVEDLYVSDPVSMSKLERILI